MSKPMKIAMMVRSFIPMPRPRDMIYAPIDLAVAVAQGLAKRGHTVTVFAPLGTEIHGENITVETMNLRPLVRTQDEFIELLKNTDELMHDVPGLWDRFMAAEMYRRAKKGEYDLLFFHHPETALSTAVQNPKIPTVYVLNDPVGPSYRELFELYSSPNQKFISISNNQRRDAPDLPYLENIYNGIDTEMFEFSETAEDYLLFAGRITPEKGVREAIKVAKESGHRILIAGPVHYGAQGYFDQYIKPELDERTLYLSNMDRDQLPKYYQKAKALLTPVQWEEPFGLTTIEAMSCGTPVISFRRGAAPEIIVNGKTGFIVESVAEMVDAVGKVGQIKRRDCRNHVERHFAVEKMVEDYEKAFMQMLEKPKAKVSTPGQRISQGIKNVRRALGPKS